MKPGKEKELINQSSVITHLVGANNYSWINLLKGKPQLFSKPLLYYEQQLPGFIRAHKTVLINPAYIKRLLPPPRPKMAGSLELATGDLFPISRRRWPQVAKAFATYQATRPIEIFPATSSTAPLLLITDESTSAQLVAQLLAEQWPQVPFRTMGHSPGLTRRLLELSPGDYPALLLLDNRANSRLHSGTLATLKEHPQLRRIPIILFVSPSASLVTAAYQEQANSVICLDDHPMSLVAAVELICRYWFGVAALPKRPS